MPLHRQPFRRYVGAPPQPIELPQIEGGAREQPFGTDGGKTTQQEPAQPQHFFYGPEDWLYQPAPSAYGLGSVRLLHARSMGDHRLMPGIDRAITP